jgi:putative lipase involved disintegration of autophagic bodies
MRAFDLDGKDALHALSDGEPIDPPPLVLRTRRIPIMRPRHISPTASWRNLTFSQRSSLLSAAPDWEEIEVEAPDTTDRKTLLALAMMSSNAYIEPNSTEWYSLDKWNAVSVNFPRCALP